MHWWWCQVPWCTDAVGLCWCRTKCEQCALVPSAKCHGAMVQLCSSDAVPSVNNVHWCCCHGLWQVHTPSLLVIVWCNNRKYRGPGGESSTSWGWSMIMRLFFFQPFTDFSNVNSSAVLIRLFQPSKAQVYPSFVVLWAMFEYRGASVGDTGLKEGIRVGRGEVEMGGRGGRDRGGVLI